MREFSKPGSVVHEFPADYRIYDVGTWDDSTGVIVPAGVPKMVFEVKDLVKKGE